MIKEIIENLLALCPTLLTFPRERRELRDNALRSILHALDETYLYYRDMGHGKPRNLETEAQLVRYWSAAAIPVRHLDPRLAEICDRKAEYWLNPDCYSGAQIQELGIGLNDVRNEYRAILRPASIALFQKRRKT